MEVAKFLALPTILALVVLCLHFISKLVKLRKDPSLNLPPGNLGWPIVGETFEFMLAARGGTVVRFIKDRMEKHDCRVFKTSFLGDPMAVFCGPAGNKFLFSNENKIVQVWWPSSIRKLLRTSLISKVGEEAKMTRRLLLSFLSAEVLRNYLPKMDIIAQNHIKTHWQGKEQVIIYSTVQLYTYSLACCLFLSIEDPIHVSEFSSKLDDFLKGLLGFPINLPGTKFRRSMKAADEITTEVKMMILKRKLELQEKNVSPTQDLLSHLLVTPDSNGRFMTETEISDNMLLLLFAGHDTSRSALSSIMKYLGAMPQVYEQVLKEQVEISREKEAGELLQWEDIQKMKYSWNVASEVMRLLPPVAGTYRVAIKDFNYAGYTIPKGWKLRWLPGSTHMDPAYFPNPEAFDASRFEGEGPTAYSYVPFGGGPRMCLGLEFARIEILVFMHHIVKWFKWDLVNSDEKFKYDSLLEPVNGLPIRLHPHTIIDSYQRL
ncbi:beta-amyrin 28-monooxygenase [Arachis duranensis]|uniref:Beta-amyrin 28-monooxygenase n=1 Tax=Arachis duranensis TaxID=130453 RepID=A0A6P4CSS0_ARADU|nr:beta-amyrin 28-monooxygenase [Arachis duranensis]